jgi:hypothetical protein
MMAAKMQSDVTDLVTIDPPLDETLEARARRFEADNIKLRTQLAARDAGEPMPVVSKKYLKLKACARAAGVTYSTAHRYHKHGELDSYVIPGTSEIMADKNDLIARRTRTGRHAKISQKSK